jgi:hypothetical protein
MLFHVINRGIERQTLFRKDQDYPEFERVIQETLKKRPMRLMRNAKRDQSPFHRTLSSRWSRLVVGPCLPIRVRAGCSAA